MTTAKEYTLNDLMRIWHELEDQLIKSGGEITPEIEAQMDWLDANLETKLDGYAEYIDYLKAQIQFYKDEESKWNDRRRTIEKSVDYMKDRVLDALKATGQKKVKTPRHSVSHVQRTDYVQVDTEQIPAEHMETLIESGVAERTVKVDKRALIKQLKEAHYDSETGEWHDLPDWAQANPSEYALIR